MSWGKFDNLLTKYRVSDDQKKFFIYYAKDFFSYIKASFYPGSDRAYLDELKIQKMSNHQQNLAATSIQIWKQAFLNNENIISKTPKKDDFLLNKSRNQGGLLAKSKELPKNNEKLANKGRIITDQTVRGDMNYWEEGERVSVRECMERLEVELAARRVSTNTRVNYLKWVRRFFGFMNLKAEAIAPSVDSMMDQVKPFLSDLNTYHQVAQSTQKQALSALSFYLKRVHQVKADFTNIIKSSKQAHLPEVLTANEVRMILDRCEGVWYLFFALMYGCGLRLKEVLNLRYKDVRLDSRRVMILNSKGGKSRSVPIPSSLFDALTRQKKALENLYKIDLKEKQTKVDVPRSLRLKNPKLAFSLEWQFFFVNPRLMKHPVSGEMVRFHYHPDTVRKKLKKAAENLLIQKNIHPHILRHSYATHSLENGVSIAELKDLLGHSDIKTTMIYLHVNTQSNFHFSPLDHL